MKLNYNSFTSAIVIAGCLSLSSCDNDKVYDLNYPEAAVIASLAFDYDDELTLPVGQELPLQVTVTPADAEDTIIYTTSDETVAYVDDNGVLHCVGIGECNIAAVPSIGFGATAKIFLKVVESVVYTQSITIRSVNEMPKYVYETEEIALTVDHSPADHTYNMVSWSSSNPEILTVDDKGLVTCHKVGKASITAATRFPDKEGVKNTFEIEVMKAVDVEKIEIAALTEGVCITRPFDLDVTYFPESGTKGSVEWSSSDEDVAFVNRGHVVPTGFGSCVLTGTCSNGFEASVTINVTPGWYIWDAQNKWSGWLLATNGSTEDRGDFWRINFPNAGTGKWRADIKYNCSNNNMLRAHSDYPVFGVKCTIPRGGNNTWDVRDSGNPKDNNGIDLPDGTRLISIDLTDKFQSTFGAGYHDFNLFALKVADIPNANVDPANAFYDIFWIRSFKSKEEMVAFAEAEIAAKQ